MSYARTKSQFIRQALVACAITLGLVVSPFSPISSAYAESISSVAKLTVSRYEDELTVNWEVFESDLDGELSVDGVVVANVTQDGSVKLTTENLDPTVELNLSKPVPPEENLEINGYELALGLEEVSIQGVTLQPGDDLAWVEGASASPAAATTTLKYMTFIPERYVPVPSIGCTYTDREKYFFGGDNRTFSSTATSFKTKFEVRVSWLDSTVTSSRIVGPTTIFEKLSSGLYQTISTTTASNTTMKLTEVVASSTKAEFRMQQDVKNPECDHIFTNGIYFNFKVVIQRSGSYSLTGQRIQVPNHEIYIKDSDTAGWKTVFRDPYLYFENCLKAITTPPECTETTTTSGSRS